MSTLDSARAKVARAEQHLKEAKTIADAFIQSDFYGIRGKQDSKGRLCILIDRVSQMPSEFAILIGDAANNLRSALDHIAFVFAKPKTVKEEEAVQFPLISKGKDFRSSSIRRLPGVQRRVRAAIERLQPYHSKKNPNVKLLWYVQAINNWDKHRSLTATVAGMVTSEYRVTFNPRKVVLLSHTTYNRIIEVGAVIARFEMGKPEHGAEVNVNTKLSAIPVFDKGMPEKLHKIPAVGVLSAAHDFVRDDVLPTFEKFL